MTTTLLPRKIVKILYCFLLVLTALLMPGCGPLGIGPDKCDPGWHKDLVTGMCAQDIGNNVNRIPNDADAWIWGRYFCVGVEKGEDRGTSDITTHARTCEDSIEAQRQQVVSRGDVCRQHDGITDTSRMLDPNKAPQWLQGGLCAGQHP